MKSFLFILFSILSLNLFSQSKSEIRDDMKREENKVILFRDETGVCYKGVIELPEITKDVLLFNALVYTLFG